MPAIVAAAQPGWPRRADPAKIVCQHVEALLGQVAGIAMVVTREYSRRAVHDNAAQRLTLRGPEMPAQSDAVVANDFDRSLSQLPVP